MVEGRGQVADQPDAHPAERPPFQGDGRVERRRGGGVEDRSLVADTDHDVGAVTQDVDVDGSGKLRGSRGQSRWSPTRRPLGPGR